MSTGLLNADKPKVSLVYELQQNCCGWHTSPSHGVFFVQTQTPCRTLEKNWFGLVLAESLPTFVPTTTGPSHWGCRRGSSISTEPFSLLAVSYDYHACVISFAEPRARKHPCSWGESPEGPETSRKPSYPTPPCFFKATAGQQGLWMGNLLHSVPDPEVFVSRQNFLLTPSDSWSDVLSLAQGGNSLQAPRSPLLLLISIQFYMTGDYPGMIHESPCKG